MTIKETAGKVLLYFYQVQRTAPSSMRRRQLGFIDKADGGVSLTSDKKWLVNDLQDINPRSADTYNAFMFLLDKGLIRAEERAAANARIYMGLFISSKGIDMIEGVENGADGQQAFAATFNISVGHDASVDSLIKENLNTLLG